MVPIIWGPEGWLEVCPWARQKEHSKKRESVCNGTSPGNAVRETECGFLGEKCLQIEGGRSVGSRHEWPCKVRAVLYTPRVGLYIEHTKPESPAMIAVTITWI